MAKDDLRFFYRESDIHESEEPTFHRATDIPAVRRVLDNYAMIRQELDPYISSAMDIACANPNPPAMAAPESWRNLYFKNYMLSYAVGRRHFPKTFRLFAQLEEVTLAGIVSLAPGANLMSHCGETNAIIRCHLGLKIPGTLPALGLKVRGESVCWEEGKVIAFTDAYQHEVWNHTDETRYVLAFDILKPEFAHRRAEICAHCLGIQTMQLLCKSLRLDGRVPDWLRRLVTKPLSAMWRVWLASGVAFPV